jgi:hypothetical protein
VSLVDRVLPGVPRHTGRSEEARSELDHFGNCPFCGALVDMRDLGQVIQHMHDNWEGVTEEPPPS